MLTGLFASSVGTALEPEQDPKDWPEDSDESQLPESDDEETEELDGTEWSEPTPTPITPGDTGAYDSPQETLDAPVDPTETFEEPRPSGTFAVLITGVVTPDRTHTIDDYVFEATGKAFVDYFCAELTQAIEERTRLMGKACGTLNSSVPTSRTNVKNQQLYLPPLGEPLWPGPQSPQMIVFVSGLEYWSESASSFRVEGSFGVWDNTTGTIVRAKSFTEQWRRRNLAGQELITPWELDSLSARMMATTPYRRR
ncbi:MAG: hypothetical protein QGG40_02445 [Myxococcota bacterium]|nr:hypothetical protein [Myxococcota bacterium]